MASKAVANGTGLVAPFPYFGGKSTVADKVWAALGTVKSYFEPFFGSGAVLLSNPTPCDMETVNDADGNIANVWRSIQLAPDEVAKWCDWPVNHADLMARKKFINERYPDLLAKLSADPKYYDAEIAGYWVWAASCWIGSGLVCPTQIPHLSDAGKGVHRTKIPHLGNAGMGVHRTQIHKLTHGTGVHKTTNSDVYAWMHALSTRLRRVRVVCGDWSQVCGGNWQDGKGTCGYFFDPPYSEVATRIDNLYSVDSLSVAHDVRAWCIERGKKPSYRLVLAGYYEEHEELLKHGWSVERWKACGGYGNQGDQQGKKNRHREALFYSPHCLNMGLFA